MEQNLVSAKEAAYYLKIAVSTLIKWTQTGVLKAQKTENGLRYDLNDLFKS